VGGTPGGGDDHPDAGVGAPRAKAMVSSGVRWAESTRTFAGIPKERRVWTASSMIDESDERPVRTATDLSALCPMFRGEAHPMPGTGRGVTTGGAARDHGRAGTVTIQAAGVRSRDAGVRARRGGNVRIGVMLDTERPFDQVIEGVVRLHDAGIETAWASQIFAHDALTVLAVAGREVPGIMFGTAVVPTYPRHPVMLAGQALTVQAATGGRLTLGVGLSHQLVIENVFGQSFEKPARHMREYLSILMPLLHGEQANFAGETLSASTFGPLQIDAPPPPVLVAALGPTMLAIAGRMASGTVTYLTGPDTIESHIIPTIRRAAVEAGRPEPVVVASLPVCVTDDADAARSAASDQWAMYGSLPSYHARSRGGRQPGRRGHRGFRRGRQGPGPPSGRHRVHRILRGAVRFP
jgi:5,10-methylenetetrahydromethanopterin reductase